MPKRPKGAANVEQQQPAEEQPAENGLHAEELDLSSDEEGDADVEYSDGSSDGEADSSDDAADAEIQEALAEYLAAAQAQRPADAAGDADGPAETSGRDHE